ncbi:MAG TPA: methionyl-tRNA formyltransferase [Lichenihabitans sp.]|jgi:methionyl-tRNA formyltransferase|nr:methionyl-tRNA formyltransferase [Lichenihabitans sp.]
MRIVFMGTPDFAVPVLGELIGQGHEIACVYTRPPVAGGRGMAERPSPIHALAQRFGLPIRHPKSLRSDDAQAAFRSLEADVAVVVAYGMILPPDILEAPRLGCLNLHASLLPRWRGAAPIQRAIMAGDAETGVAVMRMEAGLDTGPVAMEERVAIVPGMTAGDLHDRLAPVGADLMGRAVAALGRGTLAFTPQPEDGVTYAHKISKVECRIDWSRSAREVANQIRGLSPFPGAFFEIDLGHGPERIKVLRAMADRGSGMPGTVLDDDLTVACGEGAVRLTEVQRAGKGPLAAQAFLRGTRIARSMMLPGI